MKKKLTAEQLALNLHRLRIARKMLNDEEDKIADDLLKAMKREGKNAAGQFTKEERSSLTIAKGFEQEAMEWAEAAFALKVDTSKVLKLLKKSLKKKPMFFVIKHSEYVKMKGTKNEEPS